MDTRRRVTILWVIVGATALALGGATVPLLAGARQCVQAYAAGDRAVGRVIGLYEHGAAMLVEGREPADARSCFVGRSDLPSRGVEVDEQLDLALHARLPERCTTAATLEAAQSLIRALGAVIVSMLLGLLLVGRVVHRSLTATPAPTTQLGVDAELACPRCGKPMDEGYLPLLAGIHWREPGQPVGMPHALSGLPGTVGWRGRPRLHGFRCEPCEVVLFRYGAAGSDAAQAPGVGSTASTPQA